MRHHARHRQRTLRRLTLVWVAAGSRLLQARVLYGPVICRCSGPLPTSPWHRYHRRPGQQLPAPRHAHPGRTHTRPLGTAGRLAQNSSSPVALVRGGWPQAGTWWRVSGAAGGCVASLPDDPRSVPLGPPNRCATPAGATREDAITGRDYLEPGSADDTAHNNTAVVGRYEDRSQPLLRSPASLPRAPGKKAPSVRLASARPDRAGLVPAQPSIMGLQTGFRSDTSRGPSRSILQTVISPGRISRSSFAARGSRASGSPGP
jgi:hypothetical protein